GSFLRICDPATGLPQHSLPGHHASVCCLRFAPGGRTLASLDQDGWLRLWDLSTGKERPLEGAEGGDALCTFRFSSEGALLTSWNDQGIVRVWDTVRATRCCTFRIPVARGNRTQMLPDGRTLATFGKEDGTVCLW